MGGTSALQSLQHPFATSVDVNTGDKDIDANSAGVILSRPAKPIWLDITWVQADTTSEAFQIVFYGPGAVELTRSKPLLSSYTVQRARLMAPPATDFGLYENQVVVVGIQQFALGPVLPAKSASLST